MTRCIMSFSLIFMIHRSLIESIRVEYRQGNLGSLTHILKVHTLLQPSTSSLPYPNPHTHLISRRKFSNMLDLNVL